MSQTPILPAHIEDTLRAIAKLHADHREEAGPLQRAVDRSTAWIGRPQFIAGVTVMVASWIAGNLVAILLGAAAWDPPPFYWLQGSVALMALYVTLFILTTQRRDDELASYREQLTLEHPQTGWNRGGGGSGAAARCDSSCSGKLRRR